MTSIPTINQLYTAIKADIEAQYGSTIPTFGKVFLNAIALVQAGKLKIFYILLGKVQKNVFVDTADPEARGGKLESFGRVKLNRDPFQPKAAKYEIDVTGTVGATIPALTQFKSNDDSVNPQKLFILDDAFTLASSPDTIIVRALEAGTDSKMSIGEGMTATAPILNVNQSAVVTGENIAPQPGEDIEEYRQKAIEAYQLEAQGGAAADYKLWASDVQGVDGVYSYGAADNEVDVYIEATEAASEDGKGTPTDDMIDEVEAVIEFDPDDTQPQEERGRRPLNVIVNVLPIVVKDVTIDIADFVSITTEKQTLITAALTELTRSVRPFIAGVDVLSERNDRLDTNKIIAKIYEAVPDAVFGDITLTVAASPVASYTFDNGEIPFLDDITFS